MIKKDIKKVIEITKEEYSELCRDSYKAADLEDMVLDVLQVLDEVFWKKDLGVEYNYIDILEDIKYSLEYVLKEVNSEPEEDN